MAVRPLLSDGNQLCFVSKLKINWETALSALKSRHKVCVYMYTVLAFFKNLTSWRNLIVAVSQLIALLKVSEHDQEIPQPHTTDQPTAQ